MEDTLWWHLPVHVFFKHQNSIESLRKPINFALDKIKR